MKKLQLEFPIHASDDIVRNRHAGVLGGLKILPGEVFIGDFRNGPCERYQFALLLDGPLPLFVLFDAVFLGRALVVRPKVTVDAAIGAVIGRFG